MKSKKRKMMKHDGDDLKSNAQDLLTEKEKIIEEFFHDLLIKAAAASPVDVLDEADEQALLNQAEGKLADASILLAHKYSGMLKNLLSRKHQADFETFYSKIPQVITSTANIGLIYRQCFNAWIDSPHLSFSTGNKLLLGNLNGKDCLILHLFAFATCKRAKCDDCYAIAVTGKSSVGKSRLLEDVLQQSSFTYKSEKGVGRFSVKNRPILLYRDVDLEVLIKGSDAAKFRTICCSEATSVKIHSSTVVLPALWILITSNQRINNHTFQTAMFSPETGFKTTTAANNPTSFFQSHWNKQQQQQQQPPQCITKKEIFLSQLVLPGTKKDRLEESLSAVRNRVLEAFIKDRPDLSLAPFPSGVIFQRGHFIVGVFQRIVQIMQQYGPGDFYSPMLVSYVLTALCDNLQFYTAADDKISSEDIASLIFKYIAEKNVQDIYLAKLPGALTAEKTI